MLVRAYAKINLGLRILRKRTDGYHDIETLFHRIDLFDEIIFERADRILLTSSSPGVPDNDNNLCIRAARALQKHAVVDRGVAITLRKNIPIGAGLGGGSSDAAAVLLGLELFWNIKLQPPDRLELARKLGADVPYFLLEGSAIATGRGDQLTYLNLNLPYAVLLVHPGQHIPTPWAYAHCTPGEREGRIPLHEIWIQNMARPDILRLNIQNDFEPVVFSAYPEARRLRDELLRLGAVFAQLSGSGSSVFGLFASTAEAEEAAKHMRPEYRTFITVPQFKPPSGRFA